MKKRWIVLGIILIVVLFTIIFKFVYFSTTEIKLTDINGNPIKDGKVYISYSCKELWYDPGGGEHWREFGYRESLSDNDGIVKFNSLNKFFVFNFPFMTGCTKGIHADKEGYGSERFYNENIEDPGWGTQFAGVSTKISSLKKEATLKLKKVESYKEYLTKYPNVSCKLFKDTCLKYEEFNSLLKNKDPSICTKKFISNEEKQNLILSCNQGAFKTVQDPDQIPLAECLERYKSSEEYQFIWKDLNYECYTEVAFAKKDPSMCDNVVDSEMQRRCFEFLALELKDISLCKNAGNERVYEYCKFDVIKKIGDISKCSLINIKDIRELCEVYLS